jgi:hypothetical protein
MTVRSATTPGGADADAVQGRAGLLLAVLLTGAALAAPPPALAAGAPEIPAAWVTGVTAESAVLRAEVNPEGASTHYRFEYLTLAAYEANLGAARDGFYGAASVPSSNTGLGSGVSPVGVSFTLIAPANPLVPGTAYAYRAVAVNGFGTTATPKHIMRTQVAAPPPGLPDGRAWELISPAEKDGGAVGAPESIFGGGDFQASQAGGSFTFSSTSSFGEAAGAPPASQYISTRGEGGWSTRNISAPLETGGYGDEPDGVPFRVFSPGLERALMLKAARCAAAGSCPPSYSLWEPGSVAALPTLAGLRLEGATPDLGHAVFGADSGLYEWSGGGLQTLSATPGTALAAPNGAISADGARVYFTKAGDLWLHEGASAVQVDAAQGGGGEFQGASADGSVAFFTKEFHLYRYPAGGAAADLTPSGAVAGVLAVSPAGADVYYQDGSALWRWHEGLLTEVAEGAATVPSDYPPASATVRLGSEGAVLAFLSAAPLRYDNTDAGTGLPDTELYLYDARRGSLLCASCNPTGERPSGSTTIPGALRNGTTAAYRPRALSADGRRLFFDTTDALTGVDTDSATDVYQWEADGEGGCAEARGCIRLISGGRGAGGRFLDASASGDDTFFLSGDSLVGSDPGSIDVYDARVGGGIPEPAAPFVCKGDACQALPSPPEDPSAGTLLPSSGNPPLAVEKLKGRRRCPKGKVRRKGFCLRRLHHRGKHRHRSHR